MSLQKIAQRYIFVVFPVMLALLLSACATVPRESIELSNTVGRDLEEVHRSHRALAELLFDMIEKDANRFIDEVFAPAYITAFANEFELDKTVRGIVEQAPQNLLPVLIRFVDKATQRIERERAELLSPLREQRKKLLDEIDASHRQIQAAQAILAGHLASVLRVHDAQNEAFKEVGLEDIRGKVADVAGGASDKIAALIVEAEKANGEIDKLEEVMTKIKETIQNLGESDE